MLQQLWTLNSSALLRLVTNNHRNANILDQVTQRQPIEKFQHFDRVCRKKSPSINSSMFDEASHKSLEFQSFDQASHKSPSILVRLDDNTFEQVRP